MPHAKAQSRKGLTTESTEFTEPEQLNAEFAEAAEPEIQGGGGTGTASREGAKSQRSHHREHGVHRAVWYLVLSGSLWRFAALA